MHIYVACWESRFTAFMVGLSRSMPEWEVRMLYGKGWPCLWPISMGRLIISGIRTNSKHLGCRACLVCMNMTPNEGRFTKEVESQTAKIPSMVFLGLAVGSMAVSAGLKIAGCNKTALFLGQWAAPFLLLGIYNKIVKTDGHD